MAAAFKKLATQTDEDKLQEQRVDDPQSTPQARQAALDILFQTHVADTTALGAAYRTYHAHRSRLQSDSE
ncbi:hypothetical protein N7462_001189 [Penicillium macrosclerotiorum]|uniref:uncharacterized protein n=1 Tax=Penicillium macrosclerotiorum TaxID=303699 RepID=UPI00254912E2|nr:uncharacterized protein N7462_001189 [Penicillium macrosclerotiorum]KAJ5691766.1 hypothetical protein N7462_001189 [Penicillium macrosclerotiorum]